MPDPFVKDSQQVDALVNQAMTQGVFPGAVVLAVRRGKVVFERAYGVADLFSRRPMTTDTCFDLASLTKPLATTLAVMVLVQAGRLVLDEPIERYIAAFRGTGKAGVTVRQLLCHCSGLPAWRPYYKTLMGVAPDKRRKVLQGLLLEEPLQERPGQAACYSDLGFMLLQWLIEALVQESMARFVVRAVYAPLGVSALFFPCLNNAKQERAYAATEWCFWRNRLLVGEVHDDNASAMGGCAGQAGLFGTARGIYGVLQGLSDTDSGRADHPFWDRELVQDFFMRQGSHTWALGFDTPSPEGSSAGRYFSANSVGHLGFTGTSFWMDRERSVMVILLTNRVHPTRFNVSIRRFRPLLHDALTGALT